jgi:GNAT superfamily N-acetyltransferase
MTILCEQRPHGAAPPSSMIHGGGATRTGDRGGDAAARARAATAARAARALARRRRRLGPAPARGRENEWKIRLWVEDGRVVAWSWLKKDGRDRLEHDVHPDYVNLLDEILAEPDARVALAFEDDAERRAALERHGFTRPVDAMHYLVLDLPELPEPPQLPDGFRCRTVGPADVAERVSIHREVWAPSRVTESSYAQVRAEWPYRESLDCVVEAPDGRFAAYCLCWPDEHGVGELEPVGVRPEFRRRGLGAAVCTFALRSLYEEGGRQAIVYCATPPACALYESLGFRIHASLVGYSR